MREIVCDNEEGREGRSGTDTEEGETDKLTQKDKEREINCSDFRARL